MYDTAPPVVCNSSRCVAAAAPVLSTKSTVAGAGRIRAPDTTVKVTGTTVACPPAVGVTTILAEYEPGAKPP